MAPLPDEGLRNEIAAMKFNADMGYEDFYEFATKLSENWALIEGNELLKPKYFYQELMRLMPTAPVTSQMVQIRSKLVTMVTEKHEILGTVKKCLRVLMEFGEVLGLKARMAHGAGGAIMYTGGANAKTPAELEAETKRRTDRKAVADEKKKNLKCKFCECFECGNDPNDPTQKDMPLKARCGHGDSSRAHLDSICPWPARDGSDIHAMDISPETCCYC